MTHSVVDPLKARVTVTLKDGVLDPQGQAITKAIAALGASGVVGVRQGKIFDIELDLAKINAQNLNTQDLNADELLKDIATRLLANGVIEQYTIKIFDEDGS